VVSLERHRALDSCIVVHQTCVYVRVHVYRWKLSDAPEKLRCIFDLYDHDEDRTLTAEETAEMLAALCHGDPNGSSLCSTLQQLVLEHDEALEEFEDLHRDILCLTDDRVFDSKVRPSL
jgi:hypothetical protein